MILTKTVEMLKSILPIDKAAIEGWAFVIYLLYIFAIPLKAPPTLLSVLSLMLFAFITFKILTRDWKWSRFDWLVIIFSAILLFSSIFSIDKIVSFKYFKKDILTGLLIYFSTTQLLNRERLKWLVRTLLLSFGAAVALSFGRWGHSHRLYGIFGHHTRYGKFLDISAPFTFSALFAEKIYIVFLCLILLMASLYSLFLTMSRGAWVGVFFSVIFMLILLKKWCVFPIIAILVAILFLLVPFKKEIRNRAMSILTLPKAIKTDKSLSSRVRYYKTALRLIEMRPVLGWGYGRKIPRRVRKRLGEGWFKQRGLKPFKHHAHNSYLEIALEAGILGLASFLVMMVIFAFRGWMLITHGTDSYIRAVALGIIGGMLALLIHGLADNIFQKPYISYIFLFIATVISIERGHE